MRPDFEDLDTVYLSPGEVFYSKRPIIVCTLLGSCLSVIMRCKRTSYSAISHCELPSSRYTENLYNENPAPYRYVDNTIYKMLQTFERMKISKDDIEVKIFGGADVLEALNSNRHSSSIGNQNIETAIKMLNQYSLKITASDIGGRKGRKIFFHTGTGDVFLNRLKNNEKNKSLNS